MDYTDFAMLQRESPGHEMTVFPDGSVDTYYTIHDGDAEWLSLRAAFGEQIADDADTFSINHVATKPGGQVVNIAQQTHALGDET